MDVQQINDYLDMAIARWRSKRDEEFAKHGLDVQAVYTSGDFDSLSTDCLMAVCYVDAYNSVKVSIGNTSNIRCVASEMRNVSDKVIVVECQECHKTYKVVGGAAIPICHGEYMHEAE